MKTYAKYGPILALSAIYLVGVLLILHYYPLPQFSWDSYYYVEKSIKHEKEIRPSGYSYVLDYAYGFSKSIQCIIWLQFTAYFLAIAFFLQTLKKYYSLTGFKYFLTGLLLLTEPVALYHCNSILSDVLFASCSIIAIAFLIRYLHSGRYYNILAHVLFIILSIELRHIALFYPFFTLLVLVLFSKRNWLLLVNICLVLGAYSYVYKWHVNKNLKETGVAIFTPFSGWTATNNALYALPRIKLDAKYIEQPLIRDMHAFFSNYLDTTSYIPYQVGSGYLWDQRSPMNVIRQRAQDSLNIDFFGSWYTTAPQFTYYGTYIQKHFPYEYVMAYMVPNLKTLLKPHVGEMTDYNATEIGDNEIRVLKRYGLKKEDMVCRKQVYRDTINNYIPRMYTLALLLTLASTLIFVIYFKRFDLNSRKIFGVFILFIGSFYGLTLYSSWFMYRYLLPVLPLMISFIIMLWGYILANRQSLFTHKSPAL